MTRKKKQPHAVSDLDDDFGVPTAVIEVAEKPKPGPRPDEAEVEHALTSYRAPGALEEAELELRDMLVTDPEKIMQAFVDMAPQIAWAATRHASTLRAHLLAKARVKKLRGLLEIQAREEIKDEGYYPKPTESQVAARVEQDPRWEVAQEEEIETEVRRELSKGLLEAARCKRDMLVSLGATLRAELERDPTIRDRLDAARGGG